MIFNDNSFKILKEFTGNKESKVQLVENKKSKQLFVFKEVKIIDLSKQMQEIEIHKRLDHPFIIKLLEFEVNNSNVNLLIEFAKNGDLFSWINRMHVLSEKTIIKFFFESVCAVSYLHSQGIVHSDIKPENILVAKHFSPRLADFGASFFVGKLTHSFCGTLEYMAPEILFAEKQDEKVDIWSLGILLYEMFHGVSPYRGLSSTKIKDKMKSNDIRFKLDLNYKVKNLILKILKINPNERPTADEILSDRLFVENNLLGLYFSFPQNNSNFVAMAKNNPKLFLDLSDECNNNSSGNQEISLLKSNSLVLTRLKEHKISKKSKYLRKIIQNSLSFHSKTALQFEKKMIKNNINFYLSELFNLDISYKIIFEYFHPKFYESIFLKTREISGTSYSFSEPFLNSKNGNERIEFLGNSFCSKIKTQLIKELQCTLMSQSSFVQENQFIKFNAKFFVQFFYMSFQTATPTLDSKKQNKKDKFL